MRKFKFCSIVLMAAIAMLGSLWSNVAFAEPVRAVYVVSLTDPPLVTRALQRTSLQMAMRAGSADQFNREPMPDLISSESRSDLQALAKSQAAVLAIAAQTLQRSLVTLHQYRYVANGLALELSEREAEQIAALPGVRAVRREQYSHLLTDAGPQWIGADRVWNGPIAGVPATRGEGVVIGIIDSGINPTHPAFAAHGGDGYSATNPRGRFYGLCAASGHCNAKLIGMYDFTDEGTQGLDSTGHGSHVAGIAAGNIENSTLVGHTINFSRMVAGVAPHASLITYKACTSNNQCPGSALLAAIDQAVADGVDVINYSIGSAPSDPFAALDSPFDSDVKAFFQARAAGIVVVAATGNEGPERGSIDTPAVAPWVIAVANASHNRIFVNSLLDLTSSGASLNPIQGQGFTSGYGPNKIVSAADFGFPLCSKGDNLDFPPTGASNPWPAGTFHGEIVVCERGTTARVTKSYNVQAAGAGGMILVNSVSDGDSVVSDDHYLPAVHIGYQSGIALKAWLTSGSLHTGRISGVSANLDTANGDVLDSSSSRGPTGFSGGILKPDITAPGRNILSAAQTGNGLALLTGTSMASPHIAGTVALIRAVHRDWSPAQVESALLSSALAGSVRKEDGQLATPLDAGAGRAQPASAVVAGLYLPLSNNDISAQNPAHGGDSRRINRPGIEDKHCFQQCDFMRTVVDQSGGGTWQVSVSGTEGAIIQVTPAQFTLSRGAAQTLKIAVDVSAPSLPGTWISGRVVLHKVSNAQSGEDVALTLAVYADPGVIPAFQEIGTLDSRGFSDMPLEGLGVLPQASFRALGLVPAVTKSLTLSLDPTSSDAFDLPSPGVDFVLLPVNGSGMLMQPLHARVAIVEAIAANAPAVELYVGTDSNGDGIPQPSETLCHSNQRNGAVARCVVDVREHSMLWVLTQIPEGISGGHYSVNLATGVLYNDDDTSLERLIATGPGHVASLAPFSVRLSYQASLAINQRYFGAVLVDGAPGMNGQSGLVPFAITRFSGNSDPTYAFRPDAGSTQFILAPGKALEHSFIDVPANASRLLIQASAVKGLDLYAARSVFPAPSTDPIVAPAPARDQAQAVVLHSSATAESGLLTIELRSETGLKPGRWYISPVNTDSVEHSFGISTELSYVDSASPPHLIEGNYYNTQRSGHGIFLGEGGDQRALSWYTYLQDGTPVWYVAQAAKPVAPASVWQAPLFRVVWDGAQTHLTEVGDVLLTSIADNQFIYSWRLDGQAGSEVMEVLSQPSCPMLNGTPIELSGAWYAPAQSGYGINVLTLSRIEVMAFYFYDDLGSPRWVIGSVEPFGAATLPMLQLRGFCPLCTYIPYQTQPAGTITRNYSSANTGQLSTQLQLTAPLSGSWNIDQPMARLTGSASCTQ